MHPSIFNNLLEVSIMAKRIVKWSLDGSILKMAKALDDPKATAEILADFDLTKVYVGFMEMTEVQRQIIVYGIKQKLMDVGASEVAEVSGKVTAAKKKWDELLAGRWEGERVNSTGAADNKKALAAVKEASKVVSLQGLLLKQTMAGLPGQEPFTEEDQAKLDEFIKAMMKGKK
jgi:hypothetical protein